MMEEQILKIIQKKIYKDGDIYVYYSKKSITLSAKKIADHFREFITWFHNECGNQYALQIKNEPRKYITRVGAIYKTLDELYQYWNNEIKKK
jgi:hypothetical protein